MEGQTDRLIGGLTDRSKNRHTDEQLIDQTYIQTDRDMLEGLTRESTDKKMERTDRWTKRLAVQQTHGQIELRVEEGIMSIDLWLYASARVYTACSPFPFRSA